MQNPRYAFRDRKMPYSTECLEISSEEMKKIESSPKSPVTPFSNEKPAHPVKIIIDTDIGTDLDDALALLYALRLKDVEIIGVTTNYAVAPVRTVVAGTILSAHCKCRPDYPAFPIVTGSSGVLGSHRDVFLTGNEGIPFIEHEVTEEQLEQMDQLSLDAAEFMASAAKCNPGEITLLSIGIPTNIALAFMKYPSLPSLLKEVIVMGVGNPIDETNKAKICQFQSNPRQWNKCKVMEPPFGLPPSTNDISDWIQSGNIAHFFPNHNLSGDTLASKILFSTGGVKIRVIPHGVTSKFWLKGKAIDHLRSMAKQLTEENVSQPPKPSSAVGILMQIWFQRRHGQNGQCPHDPLVVHEAVYGEEESPVKYVRGKLIVHEWAAFSTFIPHSEGPHYFGIDVTNTQEFLDRLESVLIEED